MLSHPRRSTQTLALELKRARQCLENALAHLRRIGNAADPLLAGAIDRDVQLLEQVGDRLTAVRRELAADVLFRGGRG